MLSILKIMDEEHSWGSIFVAKECSSTSSSVAVDSHLLASVFRPMGITCPSFWGQWALIIHNFVANVCSLADEWPLATKSWTMSAHGPQSHGPWVLIGLKIEANEHSSSIILRMMSTHQRSFSHDYRHWPLIVSCHLEWVRIMSNDWWKFDVHRSTTASDFR